MNKTTNGVYFTLAEVRFAWAMIEGYDLPPHMTFQDAAQKLVNQFGKEKVCAVVEAFDVDKYLNTDNIQITDCIKS